MGEGEQLTQQPLCFFLSIETYQLSEEKKYRTSRDSLTSIFIPLLKENRSPHHANSIYLRHSFFKKASVVRNPKLH